MSLWKWLSIYLVAVCPVKWVEIRYCVQEIHFIVHLVLVHFFHICSKFFCSFLLLLYSAFCPTFFRFVKLLFVNCVVTNNNSKICQFQCSWCLKVFDPSISCHIWMRVWALFPLSLNLVNLHEIEQWALWAATVGSIRIRIDCLSILFFRLCESKSNYIRNWITARLFASHECYPVAVHSVQKV